MSKKTTAALLPLVLLSLTAQAQELEFPAPTEAHQWLQRFVGEWTSTARSVGGPDESGIEYSSTMKSRAIGGFWVVNEIRGEVNGAKMVAVQTIGYDAAKKKYVGTWTDSMMGHLWVYEGTVDDSGKKLVLETKGPDFAGSGSDTGYRDSFEFKTDDLVISTAEIQNEAGEWTTFMTGEMRRK